jgi:hypothetical protein
VNPLDDDEEAWPDEPEELDPDELGPSAPDPASNVDTDAAGAIGDVDEELLRSFWGAVFFLNVALLAVAVGSMLVYFRGDWSSGGAGLTVGGVSAVFAARYYRQGRSHADRSGETGGDTEAGPR